MTTLDHIFRIQAAYPRIYHACHARHQNQQTASSGLSQRDATILAHLNRDEPITQTMLAQHLGIAKSTMSAAITDLFDGGYIERETSADQRSHHLRLSLAGQRAMSAGSVLEADKLAALLAMLSDDEAQQALQGLELLAEATFRLTSTKGEQA